jgi:hypothetical protein
MTELTPTAESRLNAYVHELRRVLSGSPSVDPADVERDVRDHIDAALVGQAAPIDDSALNHVLQTLGSPAQWLLESARPARRPIISYSAIKQSAVQFARHLAGGAESYRLAYLSLLVFAAGWGLTLLAQHPGPLVVAMPVSFIFSRAALSLFSADEIRIGQKWLLYPILVVVYSLPLLVIVGAPIAIGIRVRVTGSTLGEAIVAVCGWSGAAWLCTGVVAALFPGIVRNVFHPFATRFSRRSGFKLATIGLVLLIAGAVTFFTLPKWRG